MTAVQLRWNDSIYTPLVTLWVFLGQVMSADHSCRAAVARLIAHRLSQGQSACSAKTGAYCQARKRLPEKFFSCVARLVGKTLDADVDPAWLWKGRPVYMFDGTMVSMPDTRMAIPEEMPVVIHQMSNYNDGQVMSMVTHLNNYFANNGLPFGFVLCEYIDYDTTFDASGAEVQALAEEHNVPNKWHYP